MPLKRVDSRNYRCVVCATVVTGLFIGTMVQRQVMVQVMLVSNVQVLVCGVQILRTLIAPLAILKGNFSERYSYDGI